MPPTEALVALLGLIAVISTAAAAVLVIVLHLLPTDVDAVREGVSGYALGRWAPLYQLQVIGCGVAAALIVVGCCALGIGSVAGLVGLGAYAATRFAIVRYPTDPPGTVALSRTGRMHALLAAVAFISLAVAAPTLGFALASSPPWDRIDAALIALSVAVPVTAAATFASGGLPAFRPLFGLVERTLYATGLSWLLLVALGLALNPLVA
jgi:hypothetical protein